MGHVCYTSDTSELLCGWFWEPVFITFRMYVPLDKDVRYKEVLKYICLQYFDP